MDERRSDPPPWLPAARREAPQPAVPPARDRPGWGPPEPPKPRRRIEWRKYVKTPRGAVGLGLLAAGLLLWPFSGFSWIPLLVGLGALVVLRLLRFDGLLRGWDFPLAGLIAVVGLMWSTSPWAWALAASIGVLIAGLLQLPAWKLAVVGVVLCVGSGVGLGISAFQTRQQLDEIQKQAGDVVRPELGSSTAEKLLPTLLGAIADRNTGRFCILLVGDAEAQFAASAGGGDCAAAVLRLAADVRQPDVYRRPIAPVIADGFGWSIDACNIAWTAAQPGPPLGKLRVEKVGGDTGSYFVTGFSPCT